MLQLTISSSIIWISQLLAYISASHSNICNRVIFEAHVIATDLMHFCLSLNITNHKVVRFASARKILLSFSHRKDQGLVFSDGSKSFNIIIIVDEFDDLCYYHKTV